MNSWRGVLTEYRDRLQLEGLDNPVTLLEGGTPLIPAPRLASWIAGGFELYLKYEGVNPTGSFKDRGMTAAITVALAQGAKTVICASTGNTAASAAAYAARAGLKCIVLIPDGKIAVGKLAASLSYGASVVAIKGSFDDGLHLVREIAEKTPIALVNSVNPARLQGQKTGAFEICDALGGPPDIHALPVGNAGNISAYWLGYTEYLRDRIIPAVPMMLGAQAAGAAPIVSGKVVENPETIATAIRIGNPARWQEANAAIRDSFGQILAVSDDEILEAYSHVASLEGVFCEPSSAAGIAGLRKAHQNGLRLEGRRAVAILTGHGLKDPDTAMKLVQSPVVIEPTFDALMGAIEEPNAA